MKLKRMSSKKKLLIWTTVLTMIIVIIAVYETRKEMEQFKEQQNASELKKLNPLGMPVEKMVSVIRNYYRSHDLPIGWKIGRTDLVALESIEVAIIFSPRIGDSRHGKSANPEEITNNNACPLDDNIKNMVAYADLLVSVHDKTGLIKTIYC